MLKHEFRPGQPNLSRAFLKDNKLAIHICKSTLSHSEWKK